MGLPQREAAERRAGTRVAITIPMTLELGGGRSLPCRSVDLGAGGVCVHTRETVALEAIRGVRIGLPEATLALAARGAWQRAMRCSAGVLTGVAFAGPSLHEREILDALFRRQVRRITRFLVESTVLAPLGFDEAMELTRHTRHRYFATGAPIHARGRQGDEAAIFIVATGRVGTTLPRPDGGVVTLQDLECGNVIGATTLVTGLPPADDAFAREPTQLIEVDEDAYAFLQRERPLLARALDHAVMRRVHAQLEAVLADVGSGSG